MTTTGDAEELSAFRGTGSVTLCAVGLVCALIGSTGLSTGGVLTRVVAVGLAGLVVLAGVWHRRPGDRHGPPARMFGVARFRAVVVMLAGVVVAGLVASTVDASIGRSVLGLGAAVVLWWAALPSYRSGRVPGGHSVVRHPADPSHVRNRP